MVFSPPGDGDSDSAVYLTGVKNVGSENPFSPVAEKDLTSHLGRDAMGTEAAGSEELGDYNAPIAAVMKREALSDISDYVSTEDHHYGEVKEARQSRRAMKQKEEKKEAKGKRSVS